MTSSFVHTHVHTEYSMLDGAARLGDVVAAAARDGQPALGITDHGNMYGVLDFYKECHDQGIKPIIGNELYLAEESRWTRPSQRGRSNDQGGGGAGGERVYYHMTTLAESNAGYRNLMQLTSKAYLEGFRYKPRSDWELLEQHSEGLIVTTGCLSGHVLTALKEDRFDDGLAAAARLRDIFGPDNVFVELQDHGIPDQIRTNPMLLDIAKRLRLPLLATNDSHYVHQHDAVAHDALLCVQTGSLLSDTNRFRFDSDQHYLKSSREMRDVFAELPSACDNTLWVAERCNVEIEFGKPQLPEFPRPAEYETAAAYLRHLTYEGAHRRWGQTLPAQVTERLDYELGVIGSMGFDDYFLVVWDLIRHARDNNIRVGPGRGSAAGCAVAYTLWITDIDPIRYGLIFERFLNPSRISMPDIDMDFDSRYRDEMIRYTAEVYGRENVAQIITFGTIKARAAVRDAARVLGKPYAVGDRIAKAMPPLVMGRDTPLYASIADEPPAKYEDGWKAAATLRQMIAEDIEVEEVVKVATGLEGLRRSDSIHAAAVVITKEPLTTYTPIQRKPEAGQDPEDAPIVTQYEMHGIDDLGLLKMDFLGLRNLDVISDTIEMISKIRGVTVDIDHVELDDPATYELLGRGDTVGVFQLESPPMRELLRRTKPTCFEHIGAVVALYRPGPMSENMHNDYADRINGRQAPTPLHPDLEEILAPTQGLMFFQETMMQVAQTLAGYTMADADLLRKACGKKVREVMAKEREKFVSGCVGQGYDESVGHGVFDIIEPFADYAFNASHAFGYGLITYQTAYLKANYPAEYFASLLTSVKGKQDRAAVFLADAQRSHLQVLQPDVNTSVTDFTVVDNPNDPRGSVLFGMGGIRNVGDNMAERIVAAREDGGPFTTVYDLLDRVDQTVLNKRTIEALAKAGAFDKLDTSRKSLVFNLDEAVDRTISRRKDEAAGVQSLFGGDTADTGGFDDRPVFSTDDEWDKWTRLSFEKEMLGLYVSEHPLSDYVGILGREASHTTADLADLAAESKVVVAGIVTSVTRRHTKKGQLMATFVLADLDGEIEVTVFPRLMGSVSDVLVNDTIVVVDGRIDKPESFGDTEPGDAESAGPPKLLASNVRELDLGHINHHEPVRVTFPGQFTDHNVGALKTVLRRHPGPAPVHLALDNERTAKLPLEWAVTNSPELWAELAVTLGVPQVGAP